MNENQPLEPQKIPSRHEKKKKLVQMKNGIKKYGIIHGLKNLENFGKSIMLLNYF